MTRRIRRRHVWKEYTRRDGTKGPDYCELCGQDRTPLTEKQACRPTSLPGF